jgi:hypothetical protein
MSTSETVVLRGTATRKAIIHVDSFLLVAIVFAMDNHDSVTIKIWWDDELGMYAARARADGEAIFEQGGTLVEALANISEAVEDTWEFRGRTTPTDEE